MQIPFNKPYLTGKEAHYLYQAVQSGQLSGNGQFTKACQSFFESRYGFHKCLLTTSCTDALEMSALLLNIQPGDEVIMPSYTFVSTANAFVLRGAIIRFVDSQAQHPNLDPQAILPLINEKTKALVLVHYAGMACPMQEIMDLCQKQQIALVEDAAQAIDGYYQGQPLGSFGQLACFSFHETKNIIAGEGGLLAINDPKLAQRAEIIWEKGTNRAAFFRGEVDKYGWVDLGSSFLPSETVAAFLFAQLEELDQIQNARKERWNRYFEALLPLAQKGLIELPNIPEHSSNNAHLFYLICSSLDERTALIQALRAVGVHAVFHYLPLHASPFYGPKHDGRKLPQAQRYADHLLRLPLFFELQAQEQQFIIDQIFQFFKLDRT